MRKKLQADNYEARLLFTFVYTPSASDSSASVSTFSSLYNNCIGTNRNQMLHATNSVCFLLLFKLLWSVNIIFNRKR